MADTKSEIMNLAEQLIRTRGYHAFSYKDISNPLNIKNAAVHYHFPSKSDLGIAIIERTMNRLRKNSEEWSNLTPDKKLEKFIDIYEISSRKNQVCVMGALGPSFETLPPEMRSALTAASQQVRAYLKEILKEGKESGFFHFKEKVEEKADLIITALLSSLILNKVTKENILYSVRKAIYNLV